LDNRLLTGHGSHKRKRRSTRISVNAPLLYHMYTSLSSGSMLK